MRREYRNIEELIRKNFKEEDKETQNLIDELRRDERSRGRLTKDKLIRIDEWKTPTLRNQHRILQNSEEEVIKISEDAFSTTDEEEKIKVLTKLKGVGIPTASAILMLTDPSNYGVIDRRAWEVLSLYSDELVKSKKSFSSNDWVTYLKILRDLAQKVKRDKVIPRDEVTPRDIERTLYLYHEEYMKKEKERIRARLDY